MKFAGDTAQRCGSSAQALERNHLIAVEAAAVFVVMSSVVTPSRIACADDNFCRMILRTSSDWPMARWTPSNVMSVPMAAARTWLRIGRLPGWIDLFDR